MEYSWAESKRFVLGWFGGLVLVVGGALASLTPPYLLGLVILAVTFASFATARLGECRQRVVVRLAGLGVLVLGIAVPALWPAPAEHVRETRQRLSLDASFVAVPGTTKGYLGGAARTFDPATGTSRALGSVGSRWVVAPGGDLVSLSGRRVTRYSLSGHERWQTTLDATLQDSPVLTAVTKRSVVVSSCRVGRTGCPTVGLGTGGRTVWERVVPLPERGRVLTQVVSLYRNRGVRLLDADTGRSRGTVALGKEGSRLAFGDRLLTVEPRRAGGCTYTVRRGRQVEFTEPGPCGYLYDDAATRRGDRITFPEKDSSTPEMLQLDLRKKTLRRVGDPSVPARDRVLPDGDTIVRTDGRQVAVRDRWSGDARWNKVLDGTVQQVSVGPETIVVRVREPRRLMHRRHDRVVVLDARDGATRGLATIAVAPGKVAMLATPGAAVVATSKADSAKTLVVGTPRALPERLFPLGASGE